MNEVSANKAETFFIFDRKLLLSNKNLCALRRQNKQCKWLIRQRILSRNRKGTMIMKRVARGEQT